MRQHEFHELLAINQAELGTVASQLTCCPAVTSKVDEEAELPFAQRAEQLVDLAISCGPSHTLALDLHDWRLKAQRIHVGDDIHATIAGLLCHPGGVTHALQEVGNECLELIAVNRLVDGKVINGPPLDTPQALTLQGEPKANVERYDALRNQVAGGRHAS